MCIVGWVFVRLVTWGWLGCWALAWVGCVVGITWVGFWLHFGLGFNTWNNVGWDFGLGGCNVGLVLGLGSFGELRFFLACGLGFFGAGLVRILVGLVLATVGVGDGLG